MRPQLVWIDDNVLINPFAVSRVVFGEDSVVRLYLKDGSEHEMEPWIWEDIKEHFEIARPTSVLQKVDDAKSAQ